MRIRLDRSALEPLSAQLRDALVERIARGTLLPGERLPPVRDLARELHLAPNTVAKAYRELEATGYLEGRGRHGTFVSAILPARPDDAARALDDAAGRFARRARQLGADRNGAVRAVGRAFER